MNSPIGTILAFAATITLLISQPVEGASKKPATKKAHNTSKKSAAKKSTAKKKTTVKKAAPKTRSAADPTGATWDPEDSERPAAGTGKSAVVLDSVPTASRASYAGYSAFGANQFQALTDSQSILFASSYGFQGPAAATGGAAAPAVVKPAPGPPPAIGAKRRDHWWRGRRTSRDDDGGLVAVGGVLGGSVTDWFNTVKSPGTTFNNSTGRFLIGGTVQFLLSKRYAIEVDAMRRGFGAASNSSLLGVGFSSVSNGSSWEFPVLVKRRFRWSNNVKSFIGGGLAVRTLSTDSTLTRASDASIFSKNSDTSVNIGVPVAVGMEFRALIFRFSPELRYTVWTADNSFSQVKTPGSNPNVNQLSIIFGFTVN